MPGKQFLLQITDILVTYFINYSLSTRLPIIADPTELDDEAAMLAEFKANCSWRTDYYFVVKAEGYVRVSGFEGLCVYYS